MQHPDAYPQLTIDLTPQTLTGFASLFQHGILFPVEQPVPLVPFLLALPGFTEDYIENTVQTIFVDGIAADSLDRDLTAGSTLALSAAMPGLAGAIFRRQGIHGSLRSRPQAQKKSGGAAAGILTLKLFNSIATDRIQDLLTAGVLVGGKAFHAFAGMRESLFQPPMLVQYDGQLVKYSALLPLVAELPILKVKAVLASE
jgi:hypothetical protein